MSRNAPLKSHLFSCTLCCSSAAAEQHKDNAVDRMANLFHMAPEAAGQTTKCSFSLSYKGLPILER